MNPADDNEDYRIRQKIDGVRRAAQKRVDAVNAIPSVPLNDAMDAGLRKEVEEFNAELATLKSRYSQINEPLFKELENLQRGSLNTGAVFSAMDNAKFDVIHLTEQAVALAGRCNELSELVVTPLKETWEQAKSDSQKVLQDVKSDLESIGQGLAATQAGHYLGSTKGNEAAERQLESLARKNVRYEAVAKVLKDAETQHKSAVERVHSSKTVKATVHSILVDLTTQAVRV